jgi:hypothetical protein
MVRISFIEIVKCAGLLLLLFSVAESAAELIGKSGGVQDVLAALRLFPDDVDLVTSACGAIWSLAVNGTYFHTYMHYLTCYCLYFLDEKEL